MRENERISMENDTLAYRLVSVTTKLFETIDLK